MSQPRLATVFWLTSETLMPVTMARVSAELTSGLPKSVAAPYTASMCSGCWFIVRSENQVLSASESVRPGRCSYTWPISKSS